MTGKNISPKIFQKKLLAWYDQHGRRNLPWKIDVTPYRVWLSEIMLQQTQVSTVIAYFERFTQKFPTLESLAKAEIDDVLALWSGLGYYARARNLHAAAKQVITQFKGIFPNTLENLKLLPGIGRSTAGAILALAFHKKGVILDGNVKRIFTRYHGLLPSDKAPLGDSLWKLAEMYTPIKRVADYTQALMDLGSLVCKRASPLCDQCPLKSSCKVVTEHYSVTTQASLSPKNKKAIPLKKTYFLIFINQNKILLEKRPPIGLWGGLFCFPWCKNKKELEKILAQNNLTKISSRILPAFTHVFSHFKLEITPIIIPCKDNIHAVENPSLRAPKVFQKRVTQEKITYMPHGASPDAPNAPTLFKNTSIFHEPDECILRESPNNQWHSIEACLKLGIPTPVKKLLDFLASYRV